ncbi:MAG: type II secretion system protein GspG [Candidatus Omnitrophica bacterium]|nr:hypothetical protein [bacterium]NUN95166.1 type II secretion system protein GspG [Candidatus Omnitrophota bacterium]
MRIIIIIAVLVIVGLGLDWVRSERKKQTQKLAETPKSEKYIAGSIDRGKVGGAQMALHDYKQAFVMFKLNKGKNPTSIQELIDANYLPYGAEVDPFGQRFELQYQGREAVISSPGSDRVRGTPDDIVTRILVD